MSADDIIRQVQQRHGSFIAGIVRESIGQALKETPTDLCEMLRSVWDEYNGAKTIAQAIDLGLGVRRARRVLAALEARDLSYDKVGDGLGT